MRGDSRDRPCPADVYGIDDVHRRDAMRLGACQMKDDSATSDGALDGRRIGDVAAHHSDAVLFQ
jgi:hypothetical protein